MAEDRSLDDFADRGGEEDRSRNTDGDDDNADGDNADGDDDNTDGDVDPAERDGEEVEEAGAEPAVADGVDPAISTSTWTTDGVACERCGDHVERRWRDDDRFVCVDCKEW